VGGACGGCDTWAVAGRIVVETSSWADPEFFGTWFPKDLPANERLKWHARWFEGVEVNTSFYAVPLPEVTKRWAQETPQDFTFDVKLHRLLSFHKTQVETLPRTLRLAARTGGNGAALRSAPLVAGLCDEIREAIQPLEEAGKLSSLLLQLSPAFSPEKRSLDELDPVLAAFSKQRVCIEFRHRDWVIGPQLEQTMHWLESRGAAFVATDGPTSDSPTTPPAVDAVTVPRIAYVRLHGRNLEGYLSGTTVAQRFDYRYSDDELQEIAGRVQGLAEEAQEVRLAFNTNRGDLAPRAAARMRVLLGQTGDLPPGEQLGLGL
jgi:uncharacterized protein YecE (DUF72 family)